MNVGKLYAVMFANGVVKIGVTSSPTAYRWRLLQGKCMSRAVACISSPPIRNMHFAVEQAALKAADRVLNRAAANEWFFCSDFGVAKNIVRQAFRASGQRSIGWREFGGISPIHRAAVATSPGASVRFSLAERPKSAVMRTRLEDRGASVAITHIATGMTIEVPKERFDAWKLSLVRKGAEASGKKLDTWCITQLRSMISSPPVPAVRDMRRK